MDKICPIMSKVYVDTNGDWPTPQMHEVDCAADRCAWWGIGNNQCAALTMVSHLARLRWMSR